MPANAKAHAYEPGIVRSVYRPSGIRATPAGMAMNERTTGVTRPRATAQSP